MKMAIQDNDAGGFNRSVSFLSASVLIVPCLSYAIIGDAPLIAVFAGVFLVFSLFKKHPIAITLRSVVYSLTISLVFTVILNMAYPVDGDRFFTPFPTEILFPFVISVGVCATFFPQTPAILTAILTLSVVAMMLQGSCVNNPINVRFIVTSEFWQNRFWVFGFFLLLHMCAFIPLLHFSQEKRHCIDLGAKKGPSRHLLYLGSIVFLVCFIGIMCNLAAKVEQMMEPVFNSLFTMYISSFRSKVVFGSEVNLYRKTDSHVQKNKDRIVLRAKGKKPPGYLRGRVYTSYLHGKWKPDHTAMTRLPVMTNDRLFAFNRFYRGKNEPEIKGPNSSRIDVIPSRFFHSDVLLAVGNTQIVEIISETMESNNDGVFLPKSWDRDGAYTLFPNSMSDGSAYQNPNSHDEKWEPYLKIPDSKLKIELNRIGNKILEDTSENILQKIHRLETHLQANFSYDLETEMDGNMDPVLEFLMVKKSGHCEFFATAAALMLRSQGIPTRYVTGFVAVEPHPKENYWISRMGDCHAWVEAWLADRNEWILVEPTPPIGIPQGTHKIGIVSKASELMVVFWKDIFAQIKRGYFAEAIITVLSKVKGIFVWLFWTGPWYFSWLAMLLSSIFAFQFVFKRTRQHKGRKRPNLPEIYSIFLEIESNLRKAGINRTPTMSIRDLTALIKEENITDLVDTTSLLSDYEMLRFGARNPSIDQIRHLRNRVSRRRYTK